MMHTDQLRSKLSNLEKLLRETENTARKYLEITSKAKTGDFSDDGNELVQFDEGLYTKLMKVCKDAQEILVKDEVAVDQTGDKVKEMQKSGVKRKIKGEPASPAAKAKVKKVKKDKSSTHTAAVGDLVAAYDNSESQWILAKVISFNPKSSKYEVEDAAPEEEDEAARKLFCTADSILALPPDPSTITPEKENPYAKGPSQYLYNPFPARSPVLGVFPHTTVFYPATVVASVKKGKLVMAYQLQFEDDRDDHTGSTPSRRVSAHLVVPYPE